MHKHELIVMGFLLDKPMHGYQINREVKRHRMDAWAKVHANLIYITLAKLENVGMITKARVERDGRMPERRIYRLTSKGKERLAGLVESALCDQNLTYDLSNLGYFFIGALREDKARECLNRRKAALETTVKTLRDRQSESKENAPLNRKFVIEKDIDRFKSELLHLKKMIGKSEDSTNKRKEAFG